MTETITAEEAVREQQTHAYNAVKIVALRNLVKDVEKQMHAAALENLHIDITGKFPTAKVLVLQNTKAKPDHYTAKTILDEEGTKLASSQADGDYFAHPIAFYVENLQPHSQNDTYGHQLPGWFFDGLHIRFEHYRNA